jgi:hypothetical protein
MAQGASAGLQVDSNESYLISTLPLGNGSLIPFRRSSSRTVATTAELPQRHHKRDRRFAANEHGKPLIGTPTFTPAIHFNLAKTPAWS